MVSFTIFVLIIIFIILNGFFVTSEFSLLRLPKSSLPKLLESEEWGSKHLNSIMKNLNIYITSVQVGIIGTTILFGILAQPFFTDFVDNALNQDSNGFANIIGFLLGFFFALSIQSIFGEIAPKAVTIQNVERTARYVSVPIFWYAKFVKPLTQLYRYTAFFILRTARMNIKRQIYHEVYSEEELKLLIDTSRKQGEIDALEQTMINRIFDFGDTPVKTIHTPRYKIAGFPLSVSREEIVKTALETGYSRFPVYEEKLDQTKGLIHVKDVIVSEYSDPEFDVEQLLRPVVFIHEGMHLDMLLKKMQRKKSHLAIVVDEFGSVEGLVTIEDVIENILGPIEDEFDDESRTLIKNTGKNTYTVDANITIQEFNETFDTNLLTEDSLTLAGFLLEKLETVPEEGSKVSEDGCEFVVLEMDGNRIDKVTLIRAPEEESNGNQTKVGVRDSPASELENE